MKKLLLTLITITTLIACKKNEPIEPKQNTQNVVTCNLEGIITKKYHLMPITFGDVKNGSGPTTPTPVVIIYHFTVQYGKLTNDIEVSQGDYYNYSVNDKYCLD
jgi:hypothetical protein